MSEQIISILKKGLGEMSTDVATDVNIRTNALKKDLQLLILNFIYHHPHYSKWIMYGGTALSIIHDLNRLSVDLDFEVSQPVENNFLQTFSKEIEEYFKNTFDTKSDFLNTKIQNKRGLLLKFNVGEALGFNPANSKFIHVKIDLNHFVAPKTVTERRPINYGQLSFVILTYNMSALMASKIAAIFLREQRGIDTQMYDFKGRDIYDLLWYMSKKIVPDLDYLNAKLKEKGAEMPNIMKLFNTITVDILNYEKMDDLLRKDLQHLFINREFIDQWLQNWRENYLRLLDQYKIRIITKLDHVMIDKDFYNDNFSLVFWYGTEDGGFIRIACIMSEYWIIYGEGDMQISIDESLDNKIRLSRHWPPGSETPKRLKKYATLFHCKIEAYFKKTNGVMLGELISTKIIRMTAQNFNPKEQIILNPSALLSCELEDLLK